MRRLRTHTGFTAIDLVTSLCVLTILIGLLLPSIQQARESARRTQCAVRLGQLALALNNYHSTFEMLPPGVVNATGPIKPQQSGYHMGWIVQILPQMDHANLYQQVDFTKSIYSVENSTVASFPYKQLTCPSSVISAGESSYAGCYNDTETPIDVDNNGVLYLNSSVTWDDLVDGRSNTLFASEKNPTAVSAAIIRRGRKIPSSWASGTLASLRNGSRPLPLNDLIARGSNLTAADLATEATSVTVGSFSSWHSSIINIALGDGSVRTIRDDIDPGILQRLANRKDAAIVGNF